MLDIHHLFKMVSQVVINYEIMNPYLAKLSGERVNELTDQSEWEKSSTEKVNRN